MAGHPSGSRFLLGLPPHACDTIQLYENSPGASKPTWLIHPFVDGTSSVQKSRSSSVKSLRLWPWSQNPTVQVFVPRYGKPLRSQTVADLQILICVAIVGINLVGSQNVFVAWRLLSRSAG